MLRKGFLAFGQTERRLFSFGHRKSGRSVEGNGANLWLLKLLPVQLELFLTRNCQHRVCVRAFQLLDEQKGVCSR